MTGTDHHIAGLGNLVEFTNYTGWSRFDGEPLTESGKPYDAKPQRGMKNYRTHIKALLAHQSTTSRNAGL